MTTVAIWELTDTLGVSAQGIGRLRQADIIVKLAPGAYDLRKTCKRYIAMQRPWPNLGAHDPRIGCICRRPWLVY